MNIRNILENFPLRVSVTNYCNANCYFCSNEGMDQKYKNSYNADFSNLIKLITLLKSEGLRNVSLTGGEPLVYPKIKELILDLGKMHFKNFFIHTNGLFLNQDFIEIFNKAKVTKVAVSVHSFDPVKWSKITRLDTNRFINIEKSLESLKDFNGIVEIKHVVVRGENDSLSDLQRTLDYCSKHNFKIKFLNLEPISKNDIKKKNKLNDIKSKLVQVDCTDFQIDTDFRDQKDYLPIIRFKYKNISGVLIDLLCSTENGCTNCYKSNEIFITPELQLKPCHITSKTMSLTNSENKLKDITEILEIITESREYLKLKPGLGAYYWNENK